METCNRHEELRGRVNEIDDRVHKLETRSEVLNTKMESILKSLESVTKQLDKAIYNIRNYFVIATFGIIGTLFAFIMWYLQNIPHK